MIELGNLGDIFDNTNMNEPRIYLSFCAVVFLLMFGINAVSEFQDIVFILLWKYYVVLWLHSKDRVCFNWWSKGLSHNIRLGDFVDKDGLSGCHVGEHS